MVSPALTIFAYGMKIRYSLVLFDLDGTLLDTLDDLSQAVNHALGLRGLPRTC